MNPMLGWSLAAIAVVAGWWAYGWQGVVMAVSLTVFWLLLQFSRALRAVKNAGEAPMGRVPSAVMLQAKLKTGMTLMQLISFSQSLGRRVSDTPEIWAWVDEGGCEVRTVFDAKGRLASWSLKRPEAEPQPEPRDDPSSL